MGKLKKLSRPSILHPAVIRSMHVPILHLQVVPYLAFHVRKCSAMSMDSRKSTPARKPNHSMSTKGACLKDVLESYTWNLGLQG